MSLDLLKEFGDLSHDDLAKHDNTLSSSNLENVHLADDDDFGEFEQPGITNNEQTVLPTREQDQQKGLLLIDTATAPPPPSPSPSFRELNAPLKLTIPSDDGPPTSANRTSSEATPITAWPSYVRNRAKSTGKHQPLSPYDDDEWGEFEAEQEVSKESVVTHEVEKSDLMTHKSTKDDSIRNGSLLDLMDTLETTSSPNKKSLNQVEIPNDPAAPSNIPPPSILLSLITTLFQSLSSEIRHIVSSTSTALMDSTDMTNDYILRDLEGKMAMIRASSRILAGRKLRWKRDTHLSQSMKIGPATAGKVTGMKLTGIDRTETRREDQEATEVRRLWKQHVGGIKSQLARINAQQSEIEFVLPDIMEDLPVRTAKPGEGALTAPKCCFLCGLKRDERVARLDTGVEDSFGEFWMDHWGHVDCTRFWAEHKDSLKQR